MSVRLFASHAWRAFVATTILLASSGAPSAMARDLAGYPQPRVVLTLDTSGGVLWWDATAWVERLLDERTPRLAALHVLEYEAAKLFYADSGELPANVTHLRVVVVLAQSGLVSGPYATRPDAGVDTLFTVAGNKAKRGALPPTWQADARGGALPQGLTVVLGRDLSRP